MKKIKHLLLTLISSLIFAFLICEASLHIFDLPKSNNLYYRFVNPELQRKEFIFDTYLFWKTRPYGIAYGRKVNNKGFRGENFEEQKDKNVIRIIFLGDSCTFQAEVENEKTGAYLLHGMLKEYFPEKNIQVYNMGMPGYSSLQGLRLLKMQTLKYSPDILLVNFGHDDAAFSFYFTDKEQTANEIKYFFDKTFSKVRCYRVIREACFKMLSLSELKGYRFRPRVNLQEYYNNIAEICRVAKGHNIKIILYDLPILKSMINEKYYEFRQSYFDKLRDVAKDNAVTFVSIRSAFVGLRDVEAYFNNPERDFNHLNEEGYKLVADTLYPTVIKFVVGIVSKESSMISINFDEVSINSFKKVAGSL